MVNMESIGRLIIIAGVVLVVMGGVIWILGRLKVFDNLPGTIRVETGGITCIIPLLASILISIILTVVLNIILRNINR